MASRRTTYLSLAVAGVLVVVAIITGIVRAVRSDDVEPGRAPDAVVAADETVTGSSTDAVWSSDGTRLYVVDDGGIAILSGSPLARTDRIDSARPNQVAAWSPDRSRVALSSTSGGAEVWDVAAASPMPAVDTGERAAVPTWSPDGDRIAFTDDDGAIVVQDAVTGDELERFAVFDGGIQVLGILWPEAERMVAASFREVTAFDAASGEVAWTHAFGPNGMLSVSPGGDQLIVGASSDDDQIVYSLSVGVEIGELEMASSVLLALAWSPDGRWLVASGDDDRPRLWDADDTVVREEFVGIAPYDAGAAWSPDSERVAIADSFDQRVVIVDATGAVDEEDLEVSQDVVISATAWSPVGDRLAAVGRDGTVFVWSTTPTTTA